VAPFADGTKARRDAEDYNAIATSTAATAIVEKVEAMIYR
jgi:hypothetical protein